MTHDHAGEQPADEYEPALWNPADKAASLVLLEFAGASADEDARAFVRVQTHKALLHQLAATGHRQAGPVEWREYDRNEVGSFLLEAGLAGHPAAPGLLHFLLQPDTVLVVASVCCLPNTRES